MLVLEKNNDHFEFDILPVAYIQVYLEYVYYNLKLEKENSNISTCKWS
jgi:hypothetical protein